MEGVLYKDRGAVSPRKRRSGALRRACAAAPGLAGVAFALLGCADPPHVLEARCLEALEYRSPGHGEVESMERTPTEAGTAVSIRYAAEESRGGPLHHYVVCEFAEGDRWALRQMIFEGQVLPEPELALVNSDLLLQDLTANPERFEERKHLVPKPPPVVAHEGEGATEPEIAASPAPAPSDPRAPRSAENPARAPAPAIAESASVRGQRRTPSPPAAIRSGESMTPPPVPPAAPAPSRTPPSVQIPSPSSGGSD